MPSPSAPPARHPGPARPAEPASIERAAPDAPLVLSTAARATRSSTIRDLLRLTARPEVRSLAGGLPAAELLPVERMARAAADVFAGAGGAALQYGPTEGVDALRALVAGELAAAPEDVVVTTGSQQGLDLVLRTVVDAGAVVVAEAPSYLGALQAAEAVGARLVTVEGDEDGLQVERVEALLAGGLRPAACYVVTQFANPTGATLSVERGERLAALARRYGFLVVEDDPYGALRFRGAPRSTLRHLAPDHVVALRTASKVLAPGLRVGWLAAPAALRDALVRAKQVADLHTAGLNQLLVVELLADRAFVADHLERLRTTYATRQAVLHRALAAAFGDRLWVGRADGGMFTWVELRDPALPDAGDLLVAALDAGTAFVPGSAFHPAASGRGQRHLRLCSTTLGPADLVEAVDRMAAAASAFAAAR